MTTHWQLHLQGTAARPHQENRLHPLGTERRRLPLRQRAHWLEEGRVALECALAQLHRAVHRSTW